MDYVLRDGSRLPIGEQGFSVLADGRDFAVSVFSVGKPPGAGEVKASLESRLGCDVRISERKTRDWAAVRASWLAGKFASRSLAE